MALTEEDIELHQRTLRSYHVQYEQATQRWRAASDEMTALYRAIQAEERILLAEGVEL